MKEGSTSNKKVACKKVNRYTKAMVKSELARLDAEKDGGSVYRKHNIKSTCSLISFMIRAAELGM